MNDQQRALLIEQATTAHRPHHGDGTLRAHPAFCDLDAAGRTALHDVITLQRRLEAALDPGGLSSTAHAVLARVRAASGS